MTAVPTFPFIAPPKTKPDPAVPHGRLLTKRQTADVLSCCVRTVDNLHAAGKLPYVKIGAKALIDPADLRRLIEAAKE
jgi:excisionase family DNA binding protein